MVVNLGIRFVIQIIKKKTGLPQSKNARKLQLLMIEIHDPCMHAKKSSAIAFNPFLALLSH